VVIKTKRWNDPIDPDDGYRVLVCRYRPRGVRRDKETWDAWLPQLGPSVELHAAVYGKSGIPIGWEEYVARYTAEMATQSFWIRGFAERAKEGEALTLLCSSACVEPSRCHRTVLHDLIEREGTPRRDEPPRVIRRRARE
jgi:uncharacterized protein YeaO (DUF488 family)